MDLHTRILQILVESLRGNGAILTIIIQTLAVPKFREQGFFVFGHHHVTKLRVVPITISRILITN